MPKKICVVFTACRGWDGFISGKERRRQWQLVQAAASCCESAAPWRKRPRPVASVVAGTAQLSIHQSNPWYSTVALLHLWKSYSSDTERARTCVACVVPSDQDVEVQASQTSPTPTKHARRGPTEELLWKVNILTTTNKSGNIRCISWRWISWFCQSWHKQVWDDNWDRTAKGAGQRKWHWVQQDHRGQHDK